MPPIPSAIPGCARVPCPPQRAGQAACPQAYSTHWQVIEVRKDDDTDPYEQLVWGTRYVDDLAIRYYDPNTTGTPQTQYILNDAMFNVTALTDSSGAVIERYMYTPYGERTVLDPNWSEDADGESEYAMPYGHQGLRHDPETGLIENRMRMRHVTLGRFVQRDPRGTTLTPAARIRAAIAKANRPGASHTNSMKFTFHTISSQLMLQYEDGMSLYQYERANPSRWLDPSGLACRDWEPDGDWYWRFETAEPGSDAPIRTYPAQADVARGAGYLVNSYRVGCSCLCRWRATRREKQLCWRGTLSTIIRGQKDDWWEYRIVQALRPPRYAATRTKGIVKNHPSKDANYCHCDRLSGVPLTEERRLKLKYWTPTDSRWGGDRFFPSEAEGGPPVNPGAATYMWVQ